MSRCGLCWDDFSAAHLGLGATGFPACEALRDGGLRELLRLFHEAWAAGERAEAEPPARSRSARARLADACRRTDSHARRCVRCRVDSSRGKARSRAVQCAASRRLEAAERSAAAEARKSLDPAGAEV